MNGLSSIKFKIAVSITLVVLAAFVTLWVLNSAGHSADLVISGIVIALAGLSAYFILYFSIDSPLQRLVQVSRNIKNCQYNSEYPSIEPNDELSEIAHTLYQVGRREQYLTQVLEKVSKGVLDFSAENTLFAGELKEAVQKLQQSLKAKIRQFKEIANGNLTTNAEVFSENDEIGNAIVKMVDYLREATKVAEQLADGDLSVSIQPKTDDDRLGIALYKMIVNLRGQLSEIRNGIEVLASSGAEISSTISEISAAASQTASAITETATSVKQVKQSAEMSIQKAELVTENAKKAVEVTHTGSRTVNEILQSMEKIHEQMANISESIILLSEQSQAIGDIIATVNDLAEQSNLLAVNAAIEAAKAGEQGKGFAVVAMEVKSLAEQSKKATAQVKNLLSEIQKATGTAVMATENGSKAVEAGMQLSNATSESISHLGETVEEAAMAMTQIKLANDEQLIGVEQVNIAMEQVKNASYQNLDGLKQLDSAVIGIKDIGDKLLHIMTFFDEKFLAQLRETFNIEAQEHLQEMGNLLIQLEKNPAEEAKREIVEKIFREAHSLKGAARSLDLREVESICQAMEDLFALMKEGRHFDSPDFFDVLHQAFEVTQSAIFEPQKNNSLRIINIINELQKIVNAINKTSGEVNNAADNTSGSDNQTETAKKIEEPSQADSDETESNYDIFEDEEFLNELKETFVTDAVEYLNTISEGLIELEKSEDEAKSDEVLSNIYRNAHSLKGGAASLRYQDFAAVCQEIESVFSLLKNHKTNYHAELFDILHASVNLLNEYLKAISGATDFPQQAEIAELLSQLKQQQLRLQQDPKSAEPLPAKPVEERQNTVAVEKSQPSKTKTDSNGEVAAKSVPDVTQNPASVNAGKNLGQSIRIPTYRLDQLMYQSEEMLVSKLSLARLKEHLSDSLQDIEQWRKEWQKIKPDVHFINRYFQKSLDKPLQKAAYSKLDKILHYLQINEQNLLLLHNTLQHLVSHSETDYRQLSNSIDNLLDDAKKLLMLPAKTITQLFPKLVRDLARSLEKEVDFEINGDELEIDKRILEVIKDPLIHLLRNCLDHGMETPEERQRYGKLPRGKVSLSFSQLDAGKIEIKISDDGRGLDPEKLKATAIRKGIISSADAMEMSDQEARHLIFMSQFSTAEIITDLSGRGLGMSIVKEKIQDLGGYIQVASEIKRGTTFKIVLPLTLSRFRGTLVKCGDQRYVFPTNNVLRVIRIKPEDIATVKNKATITFDNQVIAYSHLNQIVQEQEVVVKPFGKQIQRVKNFSGATVMGDGSVVLIVNVADLIATASKMSVNNIQTSVAEQSHSKLKKSILVAEDSITTRTLMKHILEASGFEVQTAVDGAQALEFAQSRSFDLVVSDVEMPRLNAFLLTEALRSNPKTAEIPVVLITTLGSKEDQARGIKAGVNAYIIKSQFDQTNLLETINRLIP